MTDNWQSVIIAEWNRRRSLEQENENDKVLFPLAMNPFGSDEIIAMVNVLLSGRLTLGSEVEKAEKRFAEIVGVRYAVMVNSGSSANLLAVSAITNKLRKVHCNEGDQVLVPAVCWSTSVFPLIQNGLCPVFVDADPRTFNVTIEELERKMNPRVKAMMAVHVLGNSIDMRQLMDFVRRHNLILIEDTCESLGTFCDFDFDHKQQFLGTFGDFGTFSFYFSHHITSGEGGMVICKSEDDYNLLRCLRAHGWTRHLTNRQEVEQMYSDFDSRFLFINLGFNLRPLEVQGAMLSIQLEKLDQFNECRRDNLRRIRQILLNDKRFSSLMSLMEPSTNVDPAWFGVGILLHRPFAHQRSQFLEYLQRNGIENRPIISGNFIRQPCISAFCSDQHPENYPGAEAIHTRGLFIGIHQIKLEQDVIEKLAKIILNFPFSPQHTILVTGENHIISKYIQQILLEESSFSIIANSKPLRIKGKDSEWIFLTRDHGDLRQIGDVINVFQLFQPTRVINCAQHFSSLDKMCRQPVDFWLDNVQINNNILQTAFQFQFWIGPIKVISILSKDMFNENNQSNSYSHAKMFLAQLTLWYRQQHRCSFISILPDQIFGGYDRIEKKTTNFIFDLIYQIENRKKNNLNDPIDLNQTSHWDDSFLFAGDLARILVWALDNYDQDEILHVPGQKMSNDEIFRIISEYFQFNGQLNVDKSNPNDNSTKHLSTDKLQLINIDFPFSMTSITSAIEQTINHFSKIK